MSQPGGHIIPLTLVGFGVALFGLYLLFTAIPDRRWFPWAILIAGILLATPGLYLMIRSRIA